MRTRVITLSATTVLVGLASSAAAGTQFSVINNQPIFGASYGVTIYRVANDLAPFGPRFEPEGMVFHNGVLYVSGDSPASESNGYLAAYAGGIIGATPTAIGRFTTSGLPIGPEGITVNTRGTGFGSFAGPTPLLIGIDNIGGAVGRGLFTLEQTGVTVGDLQAPFAVNADDIAYVPGADASSDRFAILNGGSNPPSISWYDTSATPAPLGGSFNLPLGAKGLLYLPAAEAALFSPLATGDSFLVASSPEGAFTTNRLTLYTLDGVQIDESVLPTGIGEGLLGNIEALAYDPVTKQLWIGDETGLNSQIAVLTIPAPGAVGVLGAGVLLVVRRRR